MTTTPDSPSAEPAVPAGTTPADNPAGKTRETRQVAGPAATDAGPDAASDATDAVLTTADTADSQAAPAGSGAADAQGAPDGAPAAALDASGTQGDATGAAAAPAYGVYAATRPAVTTGSGAAGPAEPATGLVGPTGAAAVPAGTGAASCTGSTSPTGSSTGPVQSAAGPAGASAGAAVMPGSQRSPQSNAIIIALLVVIAVLLTIAIAAFLTRPAAAPGAGPTVSDPVPASPPASTGQDTSPAPATQQTPTPSSPETAAPSVTDSRLLTFMHQEVHRDANDGQARGAQNAPVVMVLYSDFACPFCTLLARSVEPQLADLVSNGTLRIEWRDLAQITPTSPLAAQAGVAAAKQGRFWEFHDAVYAAADPAGHPTYTEDSLVEFARTAGVPDLDRFRTDMTSQETVTAVTQAKQHAHQAGIQGTPFMIINDTYISGYRDADFVRATVLDQAAKVG